MSASARDAHVISPRSSLEERLRLQADALGATLYWPGTLLLYMRRTDFGFHTKLSLACPLGCIFMGPRSEKDMFQKYKEIIFGIGFGIAAMMIDATLDAKVDSNNLVDEAAAHPAMMLYRLGFVLLGLAFGWLLWKNRAREREFRLLKETLSYLQQQCEAKTLLLRADLQVLLTRNDFQLSDEAQRLVHDAYQRAQELQRLAEDKLPS